MILREMRALDLNALYALSQEAAWPHRVRDWRFLKKTGEGIVVVDASGRVGACAMWWTYGTGNASLGMVIVASQLRRQAIADTMIHHILRRLGDRHLVLNATLDGLRLYERHGFAAVTPLWQHEGSPVPDAPCRHDLGCVRELRPSDLPAIGKLDEDLGRGDRRGLLAALICQSDGTVLEIGGTISGFAMMRPFGRGRVIGPIIAQQDDAAIALVAPLIAACGGDFVRIDTPHGSGAFATYLAAAGLPGRNSAVMMSRGGGDHPSERLYGVASQAQG